MQGSSAELYLNQLILKFRMVNWIKFGRKIMLLTIITIQPSSNNDKNSYHHEYKHNAKDLLQAIPILSSY